jgi:hypothetical protein
MSGGETASIITSDVMLQCNRMSGSATAVILALGPHAKVLRGRILELHDCLKRCHCKARGSVDVT